MAERRAVNHSACSFSSPRPLGRFSCPPKCVVSLCCSGRGSMSEHPRKDDIIRRAALALQKAPSGSQDLDCMISYVFDLVQGEFALVLMQLLVSDAYSWNV